MKKPEVGLVISSEGDQAESTSPGQLLNLDSASAEAPGHRKSMTVGKLLEIERRLKAGLPVDEEELRQHAEAQVKIQKAIEGARAVFVDLAERLRPALSALPEIVRQFSEWSAEISRQLAPVLARAAAGFEDMPPRIRTALLALGERGWYLDGGHDFGQLWELEELIAAGNPEAVDEALVTHFEGRLVAIEEELVAEVPAREKILRSAFAAHRRGEYELSVPVLLTQADGVCVDLTSFHLFIKDRRLGAPQVARWATDATLDAFTAAMLSPLTQVLPIGASTDEREERMERAGVTTWSALNRHLVLHGESLDYGTQANSLKAISLINYLVGFLAR